MPTTSTYMNLIVPNPSSGVTGSGDPGPGYAQNISNDLLNQVDSHDHSLGKGVQVTPAGLNINVDLSIGTNNLTNIRSTRFTSQASALSTASDVSEVYVVSGNLYYNNSAGVPIQLTNGNNLLQGPTGPAGSPNITDFFQAGVSGYSGCAVITPASTPGGFGIVQWNNPIYQNGAISQATSLGTGSAWIQITKAGLYEVNYQLSATGLTHAAGTIPNTQFYINGTGVNAGSGVFQSFSNFTATGPTNVPSIRTAQNSFLVQCGSGVSLELFVNSGDISGHAQVVLATQGNNVTIKRIA